MNWGLEQSVGHYIDLLSGRSYAHTISRRILVSRAWPRDGAIIFRDLIGKLLRVEHGKCSSRLSPEYLF
jgi:hypothetical protein